jgi:DNA-binding CsgD family transcriptional regulator
VRAARPRVTRRRSCRSLSRRPRGLTNKEIAARLILGPKTVEFDLSHAYRKLDARSRRELIKLFAEEGAREDPLTA